MVKAEQSHPIWEVLFGKSVLINMLYGMLKNRNRYIYEMD